MSDAGQVLQGHDAGWIGHAGIMIYVRFLRFANIDLAMNDNGLKFLHIGEAAARRAIAVRQHEGAPPGVFWLGGYKPDMKGTKAQALADWAAQQRRGCIRFDYSGHGESEGAFTDGTIGRWLAESLSVFDAYGR